MEGISDGVPSEDGKEDCIVCPLHETAFALETGEVRGEWCPHPPVIGKMMGAVKTKTNAATFKIRVRGKNIEVRINSSLDEQNPATKTKR
jgi:nitrite reductase/ring-hydroxylating ferredoxin subunit